MSTAKRTIERNLSHNTTYKVVGSHYSEVPHTCENCGAGISYVGIVADADGRRFQVGLDCAETLSGIDGSTGLTDAQRIFKEVKSIRSKVNKAKKREGSVLSVKYTPDRVRIFVEDHRGWKAAGFSTTEEFFENYLPDYKKYVTNPEKEGFSPIQVSEVFPKVELNLNKQVAHDTEFDVSGYKVSLKQHTMKSMVDDTRTVPATLMTITTPEGVEKEISLMWASQAGYYFDQFINERNFEAYTKN